MRGLWFWCKGFFWIGPAPYYSDYRWWSAGQCMSAVALVSMIPLSVFSAGVVFGYAVRWCK